MSEELEPIAVPQPGDACTLLDRWLVYLFAIRDGSGWDGDQQRQAFAVIAGVSVEQADDAIASAAAAGFAAQRGE